MANHTKNRDTRVTLSKREYLRLKQQAAAYRTMAAQVFAFPLRDAVGEVVADFRATNLYNEAFLADLEDGLRKSSYAKRHAHQTAPKRR